MKIAKNVVVTMNYTLKDDKGTVIDSSSENGPLSFIQGIGNIITGLEAKMEGKAKGDKFNCTIAPADGYGEACLLYTSPSPRDGLLSRMPSSA